MKIYPYYMNLGTSGVIWGTFGVILECRIREAVIYVLAEFVR